MTIGVSNRNSHHLRRSRDLFFEVGPFEDAFDAGPDDAAARPEAAGRFGACLGA